MFKKTLIMYKLFRTLKSKPDKIFPLFIGKTKSTPIGVWVDAEFLPTKGFANRAGWHVGRIPKAPHLMKKDGSMQDGRVWAEVEIPADVNWQYEADKSKTKDIRGKIPTDGYYCFKRPLTQGKEWLIAGSLKVNRILTNDEVNLIIG